jgi:hypothetical protein
MSDCFNEKKLLKQRGKQCTDSSYILAAVHHLNHNEYDRRVFRKGVETVNSQLDSLGRHRLRARTNGGFFITVQASLMALWNTQAIEN